MLLGHRPESDLRVRRIERLHAAHLLHVLGRFPNELGGMAEARAEVGKNEDGCIGILVQVGEEIFALETEQQR